MVNPDKLKKFCKKHNLKEDFYIFPTLCFDYEKTVEIAITEEILSLEDVNPHFRACEEIVLAAVKNSGRDLKHASSELQDKYRIVYHAVKNDGMALEYASERLKDNKKIVQTAIRNSSFSLGYASERLRDDKEIVIEAINETVIGFESLFEVMSDRLKTDEDVLEIYNKSK